MYDAFVGVVIEFHHLLKVFEIIFINLEIIFKNLKNFQIFPIFPIFLSRFFEFGKIGKNFQIFQIFEDDLQIDENDLKTLQ